MISDDDQIDRKRLETFLTAFNLNFNIFYRQNVHSYVHDT